MKRKKKVCICRYMYVYINIYVERHGPRVATSLFFYRADMALVPSSKQTKINNKKTLHGTCCYWIAYGNSEIHAGTFSFFFNIVCDVILFENEVCILINSVTRFDDTIGTVHLSSFEVCLVSTNVIEDN